MKEHSRWQLTVFRFVNIVMAIIFIFAFSHFLRTMLDHYRLDAEKERWEARIELELAEQERLMQQKEYVTSSAHQRRLAHDLGLYAPDERPIVLVLPPDMREDVREFEPITRTREPLEPPYWQQWWELFFGRME